MVSTRLAHKFHALFLKAFEQTVPLEPQPSEHLGPTPPEFECAVNEFVKDNELRGVIFLDRRVTSRSLQLENAKL